MQNKTKLILLFIHFGIGFLQAQTIIPLTYNETRFDIANKHTYKYYKIQAKKETIVTVKLHDMDADGNLFVHVGSLASKNKWDCKSENLQKINESCSISLSKDSDVYIAVYAENCIWTVEHEITVNFKKQSNKPNPNQKPRPKTYSDLGEYEVERYPKNLSSSGRFVTYTPSQGINASTPVVLFLNGFDRPLYKYNGLLHFMASKGYFVIGVSSDSYDPKPSRNILMEVIQSTRNHYNLNLDKLVVLGHSLGGGNSFYVMKYLRNLGYGSEGSLVISMDGWFPFRMNKEDFNNFDSRMAFIQMNGKKGTESDPLMLLSMWNLAQNSEKFFLTLPQNDHYYVEGDLKSMLSKKDLGTMIGALIEDTFEHSEKAYNSIPQKYKADYQSIYTSAKAFGSSGCDGKVGNAIAVLNSFGNDINYCTPEAY